MTVLQLIKRLHELHDPNAEVKALDMETMDEEPVTGILYSPASHEVFIQTDDNQ